MGFAREGRAGSTHTGVPPPKRLRDRRVLRSASISPREPVRVNASRSALTQSLCSPSTLIGPMASHSASGPASRNRRPAAGAGSRRAW